MSITGEMVLATLPETVQVDQTAPRFEGGNQRMTSSESAGQPSPCSAPFMAQTVTESGSEEDTPIVRFATPAAASPSTKSCRALKKSVSRLPRNLEAPYAVVKAEFSAPRSPIVKPSSDCSASCDAVTPRRPTV